MTKLFSTIILFLMTSNGPYTRQYLHPNVIRNRKDGYKLPSCMKIRPPTTPSKAPSPSTSLDVNTTSIPSYIVNITPTSPLPITATTTSPKAPSPSTLLAVNTPSIASYIINITPTSPLPITATTTSPKASSPSTLLAVNTTSIPLCTINVTSVSTIVAPPPLPIKTPRLSATSLERLSTLLNEVSSLLLGFNTAPNAASVVVSSLDNSTVNMDDFSSEAPEFEVVTVALTHGSSVMPSVLPSLLLSNIPSIVSSTIPSSYDSELVNNKSFDAVYTVNIICMYYIVVFIFLCFSRNLDITRRKVNGVLDTKKQQQQRIRSNNPVQITFPELEENAPLPPNSSVPPHLHRRNAVERAIYVYLKSFFWQALQL